jgi:hypothetical protein
MRRKNAIVLEGFAARLLVKLNTVINAERARQNMPMQTPGELGKQLLSDLLVDDYEANLAELHGTRH